MPPIKCYQPMRLEALASSRVSRLALDSCVQIQQRFPEPQHLVQAREVRGYFSTIRPLLDDVLNQCLATARARPLGIRAEVLLDVLVHPTMKVLNYSYIKRSPGMSRSIPGFIIKPWYEMYVDDSDHSEYDGRHFRIEPTLWVKYLPQLNNLTDLNLLGVDNRSIKRITELVARSCPKMETISADWTTDALLNLGIIRSLRFIKSWESFNEVPVNMFDYLNPKSTETPLNEIVFRFLVSNLPLLEYIPCHFTGKILAWLKDQQADPLALVECCEEDPTQVVLEAIVDMCPNLTRLRLGHYNLLNKLEDLSPLTRSTLQISKLTLFRLRNIGTLEEFIRIKGVFIKHMELCSVKFRGDVEGIAILIGRHCPLIETLRLNLELVEYHHHDHLSNVLTAQDRDCMFQNLIELRFICHSFEDGLGTILSWVYNAGNLKSLTLHVRNESVWFARAMSQLLDANPLSELEFLVIVMEDIESVELVTRVANLPKLTYLCFHNCDFLTPRIEEYINELNIWNISKNLNLNVTVTKDKYFDPEYLLNNT